ncbi:hypothetical protein C8A01DRAFT_15236 [Parachaetomium inaequale]|uniref:DUF6594 domain-containing protein n=1 Tax=Parachaetomium inaequale TaxID=2588326 RepID=A0AAN6PLY8_9PEZI|nr:hypothetical protein C8A01DRAFT_15236 [Parachaetomium inaequale]
MAAFRRFGALSAEDLLYRQAELVELERNLREYQEEDKKSGHEDRERYGFNWDTLRRSADDDAADGNDGSQWETVLEIREKLKEYHEAVLRHRRMLEVPQPLASQVKALDHWMQRPSMGNVYLTGSDSKIWREPNLEDMITLAPKLPEDNFVTEFTIKLIQWYNKLLGRHIHKEETHEFLQNTIRYRDNETFRILKTLSTLVASLLPIAGIAVLYTIQSMPGRLGAVAGFTAVFSFLLSTITSASTKDVFSATATFAAVLVVFVGTTESSAGGTVGT